MQNALDDFEVRDVPIKMESSAVDAFKGPQSQMRRGVAELSFLAVEVGSSADAVCAELHHVIELLRILEL